MNSIESRLNEQSLEILIKGYANQEIGQQILEHTSQSFATAKLKGVIFDFSECEFINSPCMVLLNETVTMINKEFNAATFFCGLRKTQESFFRMVGLLTNTNLCDDLESARRVLEFSE